MPAKRKPREYHMYSVFVEITSAEGTDSIMLYHESNERQAHVVFARAIMRYPKATAAVLRRDSKTLVRVEIERYD